MGVWVWRSITEWSSACVGSVNFFVSESTNVDTTRQTARVQQGTRKTTGSWPTTPCHVFKLDDISLCFRVASNACSTCMAHPVFFMTYTKYRFEGGQYLSCVSRRSRLRQFSFIIMKNHSVNQSMIDMLPLPLDPGSCFACYPYPPTR